MAKREQGASSIRPMGDRVFVRREEMEANTSAAGIIIPDTAQKEKSKKGTIIAVGPGRTTDEGTRVPMSVKAGLTVLFNAGWDNEVRFPGDDAEYFLVKETDILAVID